MYLRVKPRRTVVDIVYRGTITIYIAIAIARVQWVCHLESDILIEIGFHMAAILQTHYGRHKHCKNRQVLLLYTAHSILLNIVFQISKKNERNLIFIHFL